ncbi:hypothetical protein KR044_011300, partial [Drosophila immigrans]
QMANQMNKQLLPLLLLLLLLFVGNTLGQTVAVPRRRLMAPTVPFAESFERFDVSESVEEDVEDAMQQTREELRDLLGQQLTSAVVPLTAVPFLSLTRRQPGIVAPQSGVEAALRFAGAAGDDEYSEEDSDEDSAGESDADVDDADEQQQPSTPAPPQPQAQPQPQPPSPPQSPPQAELQSTYNPYRDNFHDQNTDGSYVYGYSLPNGVRRWERGFHTAQQHGLVVEGFYAQPRPGFGGKGVQYELRCYRADALGYHPLAVEYLEQPPIVRRFQLPNVRCFNFN